MEILLCMPFKNRYKNKVLYNIYEIVKQKEKLSQIVNLFAKAQIIFYLSSLLIYSNQLKKP